LLSRLSQHGSFLENNLSHYFSPNTHLLGEALALHALGLLFENARWRRTGDAIMRREIERQVHADGSHVEQSSYYHVYALDMFRLHAALSQPDQAYLDKLARMTEYLDALLGPSRRLPLLGDDDGGRLVHPFCKREHPGLENNPQSRLFPDAGIAVMIGGENHIIVDAGPFGPWRSGHSHADTLSLIVRSGDEEIFIDPGTYTYTGPERDWFRSTAAHNTVRIDGLDQAVPAGAFAWRKPPEARILSWATGDALDLLHAECRYFGFTHRRHVEFQKPDLILIADEIHGLPGEHDIEQFWHLGSLEVQSRLTLPDGAELFDGWRSCAYGEKHPSPLLRVHRHTALPIQLTARIDLSR
jgi:hypothetical protein